MVSGDGQQSGEQVSSLVAIRTNLDDESRASYARELRLGGATLQEVGNALGLTREGARQVLLRSGLTSVELSKAKEDLQSIRSEESLRLAVDDLIHCPGSSIREASSRIHRPVSAIRKAAPSTFTKLYVEEARRKTVTWSRQLMIDAIRNAGTMAYPLTTSEYSRVVQVGLVSGPSLPRIWQYFGSWTEACGAADVEPGETFRPDYSSKWSDGDLLSFVSKFLASDETSSSIGVYDRWTWKFDDAPSGGTLRNRLGSWSKIKRSAIEILVADPSFRGRFLRVQDSR